MASGFTTHVPCLASVGHFGLSDMSACDREYPLIVHNFWGGRYNTPRASINNLIRLSERDALHYQMKVVVSHATEMETLNTDPLCLSLAPAVIPVDLFI